MTTRPHKAPKRRKDGFPRRCWYCTAILRTRRELDEHLIIKHPL